MPFYMAMGFRSVGLGLAPLLVTTSPATAATITYDLAGASTWARHGNLGQFVSPLEPGSSLTLETDANGDGVPGDLTVVDARLFVQESLQVEVSGLPVLLITTDLALTFSGGSGSYVPVPAFWGSDADAILWEGSVPFAVTGTWQCFGELWCDVIGVPQATPLAYPHPLFGPLEDQLDSFRLGLWEVDRPAAGDIEYVCVDPSGLHCDTRLIISANSQGVPYAWVTLRGHAVPEPSSAWLAAAALLALALRRIA